MTVTCCWCSPREARISLLNEAADHFSVPEEGATMVEILVFVFVEMSWSGYVALVHDLSSSGGSFLTLD